MHSIAKTARHQPAHRQVVTRWRGDATQLWDGDDLGGLQHVWKYISCHRNRFDSIFLFCFVWRCHSHIQIWFMLLSVVVKKNVGENALDPMKCQSGRVFWLTFEERNHWILRGQLTAPRWWVCEIFEGQWHNRCPGQALGSSALVQNFKSLQLSKWLKLSCYAKHKKMMKWISDIGWCRVQKPGVFGQSSSQTWLGGGWLDCDLLQYCSYLLQPPAKALSRAANPSYCRLCGQSAVSAVLKMTPWWNKNDKEVCWAHPKQQQFFQWFPPTSVVMPSVGMFFHHTRCYLKGRRLACWALNLQCERDLGSRSD